MNYKETILFIAKCLTISLEENNKKIIEEQIKSTNIDWDSVVRLSTEHYVFPALYCNLKRAKLLSYLPEELVNYMIHITDLNRERNFQIIEQATKINRLLLAHNITPIFLKGTAFLLENLYQDIAERMVGDIDFLVSKKDYKKVIHVLKNDEYYLLFPDSEDPKHSKHYPRMVKNGCINAIEIHREMTTKKHCTLFNYEFVKPSLITKKNISYLSYKHQIIHTIINKQLNDFGYLYKNIALRNYYDVFLLSYKANTLQSILTFPSISKQLNSFLSNASYIFNTPSKILFDKNNHTIKHTSSAINFLNTTWFTKLRKSFIHFKINTKVRIIILAKAVYQREYFWFVLDRITDINWYKRRFMKN